jgi:ribosomal protein S25
VIKSSALFLIISILCCASFILKREQKWSKGKSKDKMNSKVLFDEDGWKRLQDEVPKVSSG